MEKHRAIPPGYMTVGELAKRMNTTVRTLQYYDREGLLSPSAESEGGRRLYADKDVVKLHQIQCMKYLGFSLDDIKSRLVSLDTPEQVAYALAELAKNTRMKLAALSESLQAIEALRDEVLQMHSVDFQKYVAIIMNLKMKNDYYWVVKHFDNETLDKFTNRFGSDINGAAEIIAATNQLLDKAIQFQEDGVKPESDEGQALAKEFWDKIVEATGGDMNLIGKLAELAESETGGGGSSEYGGDGSYVKKQQLANSYLEPALGIYFTKLGINPFEENG